MTDKEIIDLLIKQNEKLMNIIDSFAKKSIIVNSTVNSYNSPTATADASKTDIKNNTGGVQNGNDNTRNI